MPKKTIITTITMGVPTGHYGLHGEPLTHMMPPGIEVTLDAEEADRVLKRWGGELIAVIPDDEPAAAGEPRPRAGKASVR